MGVREYVMFTLAKSRTKRVDKLRDWNTKTLDALRLGPNVQIHLSGFEMESGADEHHYFQFLSSHSCLWGQSQCSNISMYVNI